MSANRFESSDYAKLEGKQASLLCVSFLQCFHRLQSEC